MSFTLPLYERQEFIGFLFYDSLKPAAFREKVQRSLEVYNALVCGGSH